MKYRLYDFKGVKQNLSPFNHQDGDLLTCQNLYSYPYGAKTKRPGYVEFLGTVSGQVNNLWSWEKPSTGALFLYNASANTVKYSVEGTGDWTVAENGTAGYANAYWGQTSLDEYMIMGDASGSTRHTTNGTSFTNTTLAPVGNQFAEMNQRVLIGGTASILYASELGSAIGWSPSATSPSYSEPIGGQGKIASVRNIGGEIVVTKTGGAIVHFDGYKKFQNPSSEGPSSYLSQAQYAGIWFWLNHNGIQMFDSKPKLISRGIQDLIYNNTGSAISGGQFSLAPGVVHQEDYFVSIGTVTSSLIPETINSCVIKYNLPLNEFSWYQYANEPTAFHSFIDANDNRQLIFGAANGQCYKVTGTATSDNGTPITASMMGFLTFGAPETDKLVNQIDLFASPGCGAKFQVAMSDTLDLNALNWVDVGNLFRGHYRWTGPQGLRGKFMFYRLYERSSDKPFTFYGMTIDVEPKGK